LIENEIAYFRIIAEKKIIRDTDRMVDHG